MPRKGWAIAIGLLLVVVGLAVVQFVRLRRATQELRHDVEVLVARPASRQALEPVVPGGFDERARQVIARMEKVHDRPWAAAWKDAPGYADLLAGKRAPESIPGVEEDVDAMMPWVEELVQATHAERPGQPIDRVTAVVDDHRMFMLQHAARVVAVQQWRLLRAGEPGRALRLCVDGLALARDASAGGTLSDSMVSASMVGLLAAACAASCDAAGADDKRAALADLETMRSGFATNTDWMTTEAVLTEVIGADFASDAALEALPANIGAWGHTPYPERGVISQLGFGVAQWHGLKRRNAALLDAMRLPAEGRDAAVAAAEQAYDRAFPDANGPSTGGYVRFARRVDNRDLTLRLLGCALAVDLGRAETGRWSAPPECSPYFSTDGETATLGATEQRFSPEVEPKQLHFVLHAD